MPTCKMIAYYYYCFLNKCQRFLLHQCLSVKVFLCTGKWMLICCLIRVISHRRKFTLDLNLFKHCKWSAIQRLESSGFERINGRKSIFRCIPFRCNSCESFLYIYFIEIEPLNYVLIRTGTATQFISVWRRFIDILQSIWSTRTVPWRTFLLIVIHITGHFNGQRTNIYTHTMHIACCMLDGFGLCVFDRAHSQSTNI